jgi:hypothetical protein
MDATRSHARAALAALLLAALPVSASAQQKLRPVTTPAPKPAAAAPAAPPEVAAPPIEPLVAWHAGVAVGYEKMSDPELAGLRVQLELERDLLPLGARGQLSFVAAAAWFHGTHEDSVGVTPLVQTTTSTSEVVEVIPAFRASYALSPRLRLFAEVGVGGAWIPSKVEVSGYATPPTVLEEDTFAGVLRLGAGGTWQVSDRVRIGLQIPLTRRYGEVTSQTFSVAATAAYEL